MPELLDADAVRRLVDSVFGSAPGTVVYADRAPLPAGEVQLGSSSAPLSDPAILAFRDEAPGANWMHPCAYALIDLSTGALLTTVESDRPPVFGPLPASWIVVSASDRVADLVRPSSTGEVRNTTSENPGFEDTEESS